MTWSVKCDERGKKVIGKARKVGDICSSKWKWWQCVGGSRSVAEKCW